MKKLTRDDLLSLEDYAKQRAEFRARVVKHKKQRTVALGDALTLIFEDRLSIQYQIQEMLRIERLFEAEAIQEELDTYNPMIPDGSNLKATLLIEYADVEQRRRELKRLRGIEHHIRLHVGDHKDNQVFADEDLDRSDEEKTSAVHFLRIELSEEAIAAWGKGEDVVLEVDHADYTGSVTLSPEVREALAGDFDRGNS